MPGEGGGGGRGCIWQRKEGGREGGKEGRREGGRDEVVNSDALLSHWFAQVFINVFPFSSSHSALPLSLPPALPTRGFAFPSFEVGRWLRRPEQQRRDGRVAGCGEDGREGGREGAGSPVCAGRGGKKKTK